MWCLFDRAGIRASVFPDSCLHAEAAEQHRSGISGLDLLERQPPHCTSADCGRARINGNERVVQSDAEVRISGGQTGTGTSIKSLVPVGYHRRQTTIGE